MRSDLHLFTSPLFGRVLDIFTPIDFGLGHSICFGQWNVREPDACYLQVKDARVIVSFYQLTCSFSQPKE